MRHEQALGLAAAASAEETAWAPTALTGTSQSYTNELGSVATFQFGQNGTVTGSYTSQVSSGGGTITGPIVGWYNGFTIAWTVMWPTNPPALTSWTGELIAPAYVIETLWYLATQTPTPGAPTQFWNAINAGADTFTPN